MYPTTLLLGHLDSKTVLSTNYPVLTFNKPNIQIYIDSCMRCKLTLNSQLLY